MKYFYGILSDSFLFFYFLLVFTYFLLTFLRLLTFYLFLLVFYLFLLVFIILQIRHRCMSFRSKVLPTPSNTNTHTPDRLPSLDH